MQVYTGSALRFIKKTIKVSHTITNIRASTSLWIIELGISKQPSFRKCHPSRGGMCLFHKINSIVNKYNITLNKSFAHLGNLVTILLQQSVPTTPADLLSFDSVNCLSGENRIADLQNELCNRNVDLCGLV